MVPHIVGAGVIGAWTAGNVGGRDMGMEYQFVHFLASSWISSVGVAAAHPQKTFS